MAVMNLETPDHLAAKEDLVDLVMRKYAGKITQTEMLAMLAYAVGGLSATTATPGTAGRIVEKFTREGVDDAVAAGGTVDIPAGRHGISVCLHCQISNIINRRLDGDGDSDSLEFETAVDAVSQVLAEMIRDDDERVEQHLIRYFFRYMMLDLVGGQRGSRDGEEGAVTEEEKKEVDDVAGRLMQITDEIRLEVFLRFCRFCGTSDLPCYCVHDD